MSAEHEEKRIFEIDPVDEKLLAKMKTKVEIKNDHWHQLYICKNNLQVVALMHMHGDPVNDVTARCVMATSGI